VIRLYSALSTLIVRGRGVEIRDLFCSVENAGISLIFLKFLGVTID